MSLNKCFFMGNVTRDPVSKVLGDKTVCNVSVALNEKYKDSAGNPVEKTVYIDIACWGKTGEIAAKFLKKGHQVHFECRADQDVREVEGKKTYSYRFTATELTLCNNGGKPAAAEGGSQPA